MNRYKSIKLKRANSSKEDRKSSLITAWIFLMVASYFVVVPLGQISTVASTDFRLYDLMFILGLIFIILPNLTQILATIKNNPWIRNYLQLTLWLLFGLLIVVILKNVSTATVALARIIRFAFHGFVAAVILTYITDKKTLYKLIWLFFLLAVFEAILSFLQFNGVLPTFFPSRWDYYGRMPTGTLGPHHLQMGVVCAMSVCLGLALAFLHKSIITRLVIAFSLVLLTFASFAVESRTGFVGIVIGAAYLFIRLSRRISFNLIFLFITIIAGVFIFYRNLGPSATFQIQDVLTYKFFNPIEEQGLEGLSGTRVALNRDVPRVIIDNPWVLMTGTGTQNSVVVLKYGNAMHNNYMHVLIEGGLLGLFLYLRLIFSMWSRSNHVHKNSFNERGKIIALGFQAALVVVIFSNFYNETFYLQYATFSLSGQIMSLAALCLSPLWLSPDETTLPIYHRKSPL